MIVTDFPRDLFMTGAIFGLASFIWAGWAHERPPKGTVWRVILVVLQLGGVALAGISVPGIVRTWSGPTAISTGGSAFVWYVVLFWIEVVACIALVLWATRRKRKDLIAPLILAVVGIHFLPLAWVFGQPVFFVAGIAITGVAVCATLVPDTVAARSFWCGQVGGAILFVVGLVCTLFALGTGT